MDNNEQREVSEMPGTSCMGCRFLTTECTVPGGVCAFRVVAGTSVLLGDVLERVEIVKPGWSISLAFHQE